MAAVLVRKLSLNVTMPSPGDMIFSQQAALEGCCYNFELQIGLWCKDLAKQAPTRKLCDGIIRREGQQIRAQGP